VAGIREVGEEMTLSALLMVVAMITIQQGISHKDKRTSYFWIAMTVVLVWRSLAIAQ